MSVTERWQKSKHNVPNWKQTCVGMPSLVLSKSRGVHETAWSQIVRMHTHVGELRAKRHEETLASVQAQKARTALAVSARPADHRCAVVEGQLNDDINARVAGQVAHDEASAELLRLRTDLKLANVARCVPMLATP